MTELEKKIERAQLYLIYQDLLTEKQKHYLELYLLEDYSLGEIASSESISRNAVFDTLKKVEKALDTYEEKLNWYKKDQKLNLLLDEVAKYTTKDGLDIINQIKEME